jgi:hypothetical protein
MSGGSYNYLCDNYDVEDLGRHYSDLLDMANRLEEINPESCAFSDTIEVITALKIATARAKRLKDVWYAFGTTDKKEPEGIKDVDTDIPRNELSAMGIHRIQVHAYGDDVRVAVLTAHAMDPEEARAAWIRARDTLFKNINYWFGEEDVQGS